VTNVSPPLLIRRTNDNYVREQTIVVVLLDPGVHVATAEELWEPELVSRQKVQTRNTVYAMETRLRISSAERISPYQNCVI
jgi:hypothetical protein